MKKLKRTARVGEVENFAKHIVSAYELQPISDARLAGYIVRLRDQANALTTAINRAKTASNLDELDTIRDNYWQDFIAVVYGYSCSILEHLRSAAAVLLPITERYSNAITRETYAVQSALMNSVLEELSSPEMCAAAAQLQGVSELIAAIRTAQTNFHNAQVQLSMAHASEGQYLPATEIKMDIVNLINAELLPYLEVQRGYASDAFEKFCAQVDVII